MPSPWKNPATGMYYLREKVPADLREAAKGRTIILPAGGVNRSVRVGQAVKVSLYTKDAALAKERFRETDAALQEVWSVLRHSLSRGPIKLTQKQVMGLAGEAYRAFTDAFDDEPGPARQWARVLHAGMVAEQGGPLAPLKIGGASEGDKLKAISERIGGIVDAILQREGMAIDLHSRTRVVLATHGALQQAAMVNLAKAGGDYSPDPDAARFPPEVPRDDDHLANVPKGRITVTSLFHQWKVDAERRGGAASSIRRFAPVVKEFVKFLRHDDATRVTKADVIRWREELVTKGKVTAGTFAKSNRAALSAVFGKGVDLLLIPSNPAAGVRVQVEKRVIRRIEKGFTKEEAEAVLKAALAAPEAPGKTGETVRWAQRWVPWLCAYSGARVGEITQLRKEDIVTKDGVPCILITPDAGAVKMKMARLVPIHSHLIEQGFLAWVEGRTDGPLFYSRDAKSSQPWDTTSGRLSGWVREKVGITDPDLSPNHGWRHRFKTVADEVGIHPKYSDAICGHAAKNEGDKYGNRTATALKREIERLPRYGV